jgi:hypothetical protein
MHCALNAMVMYRIARNILVHDPCLTTIGYMASAGPSRREIARGIKEARWSSAIRLDALCVRLG